jgi:hypothetical protein
MTKRWNQKSFAHRTVANLQVAMAHQVYDQRASTDNEFYKQWPSATQFVNMIAPMLRDEARSILAGLLTRHDVSDAEKAEIHEALCLDAEVPNEDRITLH